MYKYTYIISVYFNKLHFYISKTILIKYNKNKYRVNE